MEAVEELPVENQSTAQFSAGFSVEAEGAVSGTPAAPCRAHVSEESNQSTCLVGGYWVNASVRYLGSMATIFFRVLRLGSAISG